MQRPRFCKSNGNVFDGQREVKFLWGTLLKQQLAKAPETPQYKGPLRLKAIFCFGTDDTTLWGKAYINVPDLSNLVKFVEDASTGILYEDDALIVDIHAVKLWREDSYTEFIISEIT